MESICLVVLHFSSFLADYSVDVVCYLFLEILENDAICVPTGGVISINYLTAFVKFFPASYIGIGGTLCGTVFID